MALSWASGKKLLAASKTSTETEFKLTDAAKAGLSGHQDDYEGYLVHKNSISFKE